MGKKYTTESYINKVMKKYLDKYEYSKIRYTGAHNKIIVICKKHGEFKISATNFLYRNGCPKCKYEKKIITSIKNSE